MSTLPPDQTSLIEYPSAFPIKVMGVQAEGFEAAMVAIALQFDPSFDVALIERRPSKAGNYLGLTLTVLATSREQLDELYRTLATHPMVKVVLLSRPSRPAWSNPEMADRPKLSIKPLAPERDPYRARVRGVTAPRPAPKPRDAAREAAPGAPPRGDQRSDQRSDQRGEHRSGHPGGQRPEPRGPQRPPRPAPPQRPSAAPLPVEPRPAPRKNTGRAEPHADGLRVAKLMTDRGLSSRREADEWIEAGWVRVNGRLAILGQRAASDALIEIDPKAATEQAQRVTVLLHKPIGYVSGQAEDGYEPASVLVTRANHWNGDESGIDLHAGHLRHLAPAGRLDIDSTGLLVLTQDGRVAKRLIGDETRVEKEYLVRVSYTGEGPFPEAGMERLRHGLVLDGVELRPARVSWQNEEQLRFVLREGRKRQIRRMCEQVGLAVLGLKRVRIGSVSLGPLPAGQWRFLRDDERF